MKKMDAKQVHQQVGRVAVLLVNLGTPDAPTAKAVRTYLKQFLSDPRVVEIPKVIWCLILNGIILPIRSSKSAQKYASIWMNGADGRTGSPLLIHSQDQAKLLQQKMGGNVMVELAMRYGNPSIESVLEHMNEQGVDRLLVLPLYPQYSATTTASTFDEIFRVLQTWRNQPSLRLVKHYHDHPAYIRALQQQVESYWAVHGKPDFANGDRFLMSFHGVPQRTLELGDPYHCECYKTGRLLREALGLTDQQALTSFQSRFGKAEWLKPYTASMLENFGKLGVKRLDIFCPGFPADCLETLEEIAMEGREIFKHAGGHEYHAIPCLNDQALWIGGLQQMAAENLQGWDLSPMSEQDISVRLERAKEVANQVH